MKAFITPPPTPAPPPGQVTIVMSKREAFLLRQLLRVMSLYDIREALHESHRNDAVDTRNMVHEVCNNLFPIT